MAVATRTTADRHNRVLDAATERSLETERRLIALLEPILTQAGVTAAANFRRLVTNHLTADGALVASAPASNSVMIAVKPRAQEADLIAMPDGEDADSLHITLAYIGEVDGPLDEIYRALISVGADHAPLVGQVGGVGVFGDNGKGSPAILLPSVPGLVELRVAVTEALVRAGIDYGRQHGYQPHITVDYDEDGNPPPADPIGQELHFDALLIVRADDEILEVPLLGVPPITAAGNPVAPALWTSPAPDELLDVDAMVRQLRTKTDPVRLATIESTMKATLDGAGIAFDATNPFTAQVLAQSGSQVTSIAQTTQLNVMKSINAAYNEGLSIPDTATLIQAGMAEASAARATLIARTELAGAVNGGSLAATKIVSEALGAGYSKIWLTAPGARFPRHEEYDGLDRQTTTLDGYFNVGDAALQFPGDPAGPPEEVCNCRCTLIYEENGQQVGEEVDAESEGGGGPEEESGDEGGGMAQTAVAEAAQVIQAGRAGTQAVAEADPFAPIETITDGDATVALDKAMDPWGSTLTEGTKESMTDWKSEKGYADINNYLRDDTPPVSLTEEDVLEDISNLDQAISAAPPIPVGINMTVFRGVKDLRAALGDDVHVGQVITDKGFQSVSTEKGVAEDYSTPDYRNPNTKSGLIQIELPEGSKGAWLRSAGVEKRAASGIDSENDIPQNREMILPRGQSYMITSIERDPESGLPVVKMRPVRTPVEPEPEPVVPPPPPPQPEPDFKPTVNRPFAHVADSTLNTQISRSRVAIKKLLREPGPLGDDYFKAEDRLKQLIQEKSFRDTLPGRPYEHYADSTLSTQIYRTRTTIAELESKELTDSDRGKLEAAYDKMRGLLKEKELRGGTTKKTPAVKKATVTVAPKAPAALKSWELPAKNARVQRLRDAYADRARSRPDRMAFVAEPDDPNPLAAAEAYKAATQEWTLQLQNFGQEVAEEVLARAQADFGINFENGLTPQVRRQILQQVMSEIRPMGSDADQVIPKGLGSNAEMAKMSNDAVQFYPTDWISQAQARPVTFTTSQRGFFQQFGGRGGGHKIAVSFYGDAFGSGDPRGFSTMVHELGHLMEYSVPGVRQAEAAFYEMRTAGDTVESLANRGGARGEVFRRDQWINPYTGRDYSGAGAGQVGAPAPSAHTYFEILSTGMEGLFTGGSAMRALWQDDAGMRNFLLGLLVAL